MQLALALSMPAKFTAKADGGVLGRGRYATGSVRRVVVARQPNAPYPPLAPEKGTGADCVWFWGARPAGAGRRRT